MKIMKMIKFIMKISIYLIITLEEKEIKKFRVEKKVISDKSFQIIHTIEMIINNENKKLSRNRKRRNERNIKMDGKVKRLIDKSKYKKRKNKDKLKTLEIEIVKLKFANKPDKLENPLRELKKS